MSDMKVLVSTNILPVDIKDIPSIMKGDKGDKGTDGRDGSFVQKAYKTYASMVADKNNIPANTSVLVNNDPDKDKNAYYTYDGTVFTKSDFDPQGILTTVDVRLNQAVESASEYFQSQVADTIATSIDNSTVAYTDAIEVTKGLLVSEAKLETKEALNTIIENGGLPATPFATRALMTASALTDGDYAMVTDDTTNNGLYMKTSGAWVKSDYDPVAVAKSETLAQVATVIYTDSSSDYIVDEVDANGTSVRRVTKEGKHFFVGLDNDLVSAIGDVDQSDLIATENTDNIFEHREANGSITLKQDKDGDLHAVKIGNVTQTVLDLKEKDFDLEAKHLAGKYADYVLAENMESYNETDYIMRADTINASGLFPHHVGIVRIPAITRIAKNKFLLFFEARFSQDDFGENSQGVATITVDEITHLATLSNLKSLHSAYTDAQGNLVTYQNACAVKLSTGRIICLYLCRYGTLDHMLLQRHSDNDGQTWSAERDITSVKGDNNWDLLCPTSQGLVKRYGQHKDRVVFPLWYALKSAEHKDFRAGYIYSDDDGATWELGEFAEYQTANELQIAEDLNGDMLFNIRLESTSRPNVLTRLSDKTKLFTEVDRNKELTNASIMCGFIQGENQYDLSANKFHLTSCKSADRHELEIHTSYDGGKNWRTWMLPSTVGQLAAYSCIESLSASYKFVLWESDFMTNFKYAVVSLNNLIEVN